MDDIEGLVCSLSTNDPRIEGASRSNKSILREDLVSKLFEFMVNCTPLCVVKELNGMKY